MRETESGSPYAPHGPAETATMLDAVGADAEEDLFDIPPAVRFEGSFDIPSRSERAVRTGTAELLDRNDDLTEFLGRDHHAHYVPSLVDHLADRQEFLTSYTQYQPEIAQGFLQALFEYQSMLVELTGLDVANCSMYDAATALGEAATLADRVRDVDGDRVLVPAHLSEGKRATLANYVDGPGLSVDTFPMGDGTVDVDALEELVDDDVILVYAENPTVRGCIEPSLDAVGDVAAAHDALFTLGCDPIALALLEEPAAVDADVVVGDATALGLGSAYGTGTGLFVTREDNLRQVPGRLVGVGDDDAGRRAYTLTLQTREQHIRRERATSNICTNQAWVALRVAIHAATLGPDGLRDLAEQCVRRAETLAQRVDDVAGLQAPVHDRHHFREFLVHTDRPAPAIRDALVDRGLAVHAVDDHQLQLCVTELTADATDDLVAALEEVAQ